jgi:hypothetical protein
MKMVKIKECQKFNVRRSIPRALLIGCALLLLYSPSDGWAEENWDSFENFTQSTKTYADDGKTRDFYQVLDDVLADFEYDIKNGNVRGLKDVAIRDIAASENIPRSFHQHIELLITEKVIQNSRTRMIQCLPCRSTQATLSNNSMVIKSAKHDPSEMSRIAQLNQIESFMDIAFSYQPSGIMLSIYIVDAETSSVKWSRSYNSETSRATAFRRGVDYNQLAEGRMSESYEATVMYKPTLYYLYQRNLSGYTGTISAGLRVVERYDNRTKEVGFEANYTRETSDLVGSNAGADKTIYKGFNTTLLFVHAWNFIGPLENFNKVRGSFYTGVGFTYTSGFLGGLVRTGYEWRLGRHWAVSANLGYRPPATAFLSGEPIGKIRGFETGLGISLLL